MKPLVICGFPGVGKSHCTNNSKYAKKCEDSDSSCFHWACNNNDEKKLNPEWPDNYISYIKNHLIKEKNKKFIFVSTHKEIRDGLARRDVEYILVYPSKLLKEEYLFRYSNRGSTPEFIKVLRDNFDEWVDQCEYDNNAILKIKLNDPNTFLEIKDIKKGYFIYKIANFLNIIKKHEVLKINMEE
jgi:hypothetical protein